MTVPVIGFFLQIPRMVKVVEESSPYFKVISPKDISHKVAPGVPSVFRILFTPEENKVTAALARQWLDGCRWQFAILNVRRGGGGGSGVVDGVIDGTAGGGGERTGQGGGEEGMVHHWE